MKPEALNKSRCEFCQGSQLLTFHHLIPRTCHRNKWFRKRFSREEMTRRGVVLCRQCHKFIHHQFSEKRLGRELNTLEKLCAQPQVQKYIKWASKRALTRLHMDS